MKTRKNTPEEMNSEVERIRREEAWRLLQTLFSILGREGSHGEPEAGADGVASGFGRRRPRWGL
jgi:hypothetical protein